MNQITQNTGVGDPSHSLVAELKKLQQEKERAAKLHENSTKARHHIWKRGRNLVFETKRYYRWRKCWLSCEKTISKWYSRKLEVSKEIESLLASL